MNTSIKKQLINLTLISSVLLLTGQYAMAKGGGHQGPPPEAFEACTDKSEKDSCNFQSPRGDEINGRCIIPPRGNESLICAPEGGRPRR